MQGHFHLVSDFLRFRFLDIDFPRSAFLAYYAILAPGGNRYSAKSGPAVRIIAWSGFHVAVRRPVAIEPARAIMLCVDGEVLNVVAPNQTLPGLGEEDVVNAALSDRVPGAPKTSPCPRPNGTMTLRMNQK